MGNEQQKPGQSTNQEVVEAVIPKPLIGQELAYPASSLPALPLDQHPVAVYLARLRPNGRRAMRYALTTIGPVRTLVQPGAK